MDIEELVNDKEFTSKLENAKDLAEIAALFQAQGFEVTEEQLKAGLMAEDGELDETALDSVAGGGLIKTIFKVVLMIVKECVQVLKHKN